jgi:exopolysaccharide biosynthesis polyprenyl glycosylphosphotransferase
MFAVLAVFALVRGAAPSLWHGVFAVLAVGVMASRGAYGRRLEDSLVVVLARHVVASAALATMATVTLRSIFAENAISTPNLLGLFLVSIVALSATRVAGSFVDRRRRTNGVGTLRVLIIGSGDAAARIGGRLQDRPGIGLRPIGFLTETAPERRAALVTGGTRLPVLGGAQDLDEIITRHRVDALVVTYLRGENTEDWTSTIVQRAHELRLTVFVLPRLHETVNTRTRRHRLGTLPLDELRPVDPRSRSFRAKYALDRALGTAATIALLPVLLAIAVLVRVSSPGPILFRQRRVGLDGREFDILKFRSMRIEPVPTGPVSTPAWSPDAGSAPGGVEGEDRRTPIGKFLRTSNLDELPQLINIAKGEMCLVGPRPERPEFVELFREEFKTYDARHRVKAGLTGWSQVHGLRGQTSIAERAEWDNYYIENWSFALDLAIIAQTVKTFFRTNE